MAEAIPTCNPSDLSSPTNHRPRTIPNPSLVLIPHAPQTGAWESTVPFKRPGSQKGNNAERADPHCSPFTSLASW